MIFGVNSALSETCFIVPGKFSESLLSVVDPHRASGPQLHPGQLGAADPHLQFHGLHVGDLYQWFACCSYLMFRSIFLYDGGVEGSADGASGYLFVQEGAFGIHTLHLSGHGTALGVVGFGLAAEHLHLAGEVIELLLRGGAVSEHAARAVNVDIEVIHLLAV